MAFPVDRADTPSMTLPPPPPPPPRPSRPSTDAAPMAQALRKGVAVAGRVKGVFLLVTLLVLLAATFFIAPLLGATFEREGFKVDGWPGLFFSHPWLVLPLSLPGAISAVALVRGVRRPMLWMALSTVFLLIPTAFVLMGVLGGWMQLLDRAMGGR